MSTPETFGNNISQEGELIDSHEIESQTKEPVELGEAFLRKEKDFYTKELRNDLSYAEMLKYFIGNQIISGAGFGILTKGKGLLNSLNSGFPQIENASYIVGGLLVLISIVGTAKIMYFAEKKWKNDKNKISKGE